LRHISASLLVPAGTEPGGGDLQMEEPLPAVGGGVPALEQQSSCGQLGHGWIDRQSRSRHPDGEVGTQVRHQSLPDGLRAGQAGERVQSEPGRLDRAQREDDGTVAW
jgi:hypothetical protein